MKTKHLLLSSLLSTALTVLFFTLFSFKNQDVSPLQDSETFKAQIGTIKIWPGKQSEIPKNWRICNGQDLKKSSYPDLYEKIGTLWNNDEGTNKDFFRIPDLRGVFIRGVNSGRNDQFKDPSPMDRKRLQSNSNYSNDEVGSFQQDELISHTHTATRNPRNRQGHPAGNTRTEGSEEYQTGAFGGKETRPKNVYVYFIIKVK